MYKIRILTSINDINCDEWNSLCCGIFDHGFFKTIEETKTIMHEPRHIVIYKDNKITAIVPCYIEYGNMYVSFENRIFKRFKKLFHFFGIRLSPSLVCQAPLFSATKIFHNGTTYQEEIISMILKKMHDICSKEKIPVYAFPYVSENDNLMKILRKNGLFQLVNITSFILPIKWNSFREYLDKALTKKMRSEVVRQINRHKKTKIIMKEISDFKKYSMELLNLFNNTYSKYREAPSTAASDFFAVLNENMKNKVYALIAENNDKIICFVLIIKNKVWRVTLPGQDYSGTENSFTYFNLAYYHLIEMAIAEKAEKIEYGVGLAEVKLRRGCKTECLYIFAKSPKLTYNIFLKIFFCLIDKTRKLRKKWNKLYQKK